MMYNMGEAGCYLEFPQWLRMTIEKRNLICFICYIAIVTEGYFSTLFIR